MERWLELRETLMDKVIPDKAKISLAANFFEKKASAWWNLSYEHAREGEASPASVTTWDGFKTELLNQFGEVRTQEQRRDEFDSLRQTGTVLTFYQAIDARRLYLSPKLTDNDCLLVFKRGLKEKIRHRIEFLPDNLVPSNFKEYTLFADKSERESLATAKRVPFFKPRQSFVPTRPNVHVKVAPRKGYDHDGDVEMTLNAREANTDLTDFNEILHLLCMDKEAFPWHNHHSTSIPIIATLRINSREHIKSSWELREKWHKVIYARRVEDCGAAWTNIKYYYQGIEQEVYCPLCHGLINPETTIAGPSTAALPAQVVAPKLSLEKPWRAVFTVLGKSIGQGIQVRQLNSSLAAAPTREAVKPPERPASPPLIEIQEPIPFKLAIKMAHRVLSTMPTTTARPPSSISVMMFSSLLPPSPPLIEIQGPWSPTGYP
ncbi:hypothetical protein LTR99_005877 [Exophiala xenobiotica]|uniref:Retrotransposon gag domain-containing protein n=1 Tax=Vermiconidia calcicola TaxID=1690605 RepID=A0AAV9QHT8_9PEZI|nr:hypothetical protein LTR96_007829 [Exophiala xenobiotica]KAK5541049.1 hypothetical protein LTR25_002826 [Vermiconidia calcicola]KAK5549458.1 hypothetical protein LTR23_000566 [Chaetothyriales sp. CCFEE 6169]KAK5302920.1 hypothetical protein LTR99_005877 [Exophiala xenobiotica]KAK5431113.1 hypothetical protein LTR34_005672 [Exophiala xenobiotica]